jgi:hypothetical protein
MPKKLTQREVGFTQGAGVAIHYAYTYDPHCGTQLFRDIGLPLSDYEQHCDEIDLPYIRKAAEE